MQGKAAVLYETGRPLVVEAGIDLAPLRSGQVLVRVAFAGVCHSQVMEARGLRGVDRYLPHLLGHEGSGTVIEIGPDVGKVAPGDRVVLGWIAAEGTNAGGSVHRLGSRTLNAGPVTTFCDLSVVSENRCVRLPEGVPMDVGALFGCALLTGVGLAEYEASPPPGATVAIFGLGGIGLCALLACRMRSDLTVIAVDVSETKLALARRLGAQAVVDASRCDPVESLRQMTGGRGVERAIEAAGMARTIEQAFESTCRGGLCVFASHPPNGETIRIDPYELIAGKRIKGSWGGTCRPDHDIPRLAAAYREGRLPLDVLVESRYALDDINAALEDLAGQRAIRPLIVLDAEAE